MSLLNIEIAKGKVRLDRFWQGAEIQLHSL